MLPKSPVFSFGSRRTTIRSVRRAAEVLLSIVQERDVAFIINDRPDLAAELGCDGVHVGQDDTPYEEARRLMGDDSIVGVTCHNSIHLAMEGAEAGADYVAFGAFFGSTTKSPKSRADLETLSRWQESMLTPCVAIGGITVENCRPVIGAGADFISVAAGVWNPAKARPKRCAPSTVFSPRCPWGRSRPFQQTIAETIRDQAALICCRNSFSLARMPSLCCASSLAAPRT